MTVKFILKSVFGFVVLAGITTIIGGLFLMYVILWRTEVLQAWLPKPPEPRLVLPVTLRVHGPRFTVKGDRAYFHAVTSGKTGRVTWSVHPFQPGLLVPLADNSVEFSCLDEGVFTITAVVAGDGNQSAVDYLEFENVTVAREEDLQPVQPEPQAVHAMQEMPPAVPQATAREMTLGALANVMSENKHDEALRVANSIYSVVKRLDSGLLPSNADIPLEIEDQVKMGMKSQADPWLPFTASIDTIIEEYRRQGKVTTAASQRSVLMEIANTLQSVR